MYRKPSKRQQIIRLTIIYSVMVTAVVIIVTFITMLMLGYRLNLSDGNLEQYALVKFSSSPSGATVSIDDDLVNSKTPNKSTVAPGSHKITIWRDGYETWTKNINVSSGTVTWLNYAILVPKDLQSEQVSTYNELANSIASSVQDNILVQQSVTIPTFELIDVSADEPETSTISIDSTIYSQANTHSFTLYSRDESGRYALIKHIYDKNNEWLMLDLQKPSLTKNLTKIFNISISDVVFSGSDGNKLYILANNTIRELNLSDETISKALVSNVQSFNFYSESKVITFKTKSDANSETTLGLYRIGDSGPSEIKRVSSKFVNNIATTEYYNDNYVAFSEGKDVVILSGSYPKTTSDDANSLKEFASFSLDYDVKKLSFSPSGQYLLIQSGDNYTSYDLEYQKLSQNSVSGSGASFTLKWLDDNYLWSNRDGELVIREFDGQNQHLINKTTPVQDVMLTSNGRYIYSFNKIGEKYQLQRVRMILP